MIPRQVLISSHLRLLTRRKTDQGLLDSAWWAQQQRLEPLLALCVGQVARRAPPSLPMQDKIFVWKCASVETLLACHRIGFRPPARKRKKEWKNTGSRPPRIQETGKIAKKLEKWAPKPYSSVHFSCVAFFFVGARNLYFFCGPEARNPFCADSIIFWCLEILPVLKPLACARQSRHWHLAIDLHKLPGGQKFRVKLSRRKIKGQHDEGQQAWEVLRGKSASERVSERVSEREGFRGLQRFLDLEVFRGFSEVFRGFQRFFKRPSQKPSQSAIFLSELQVVLPQIALPLKTPATLPSFYRISTEKSCKWMKKTPVYKPIRGAI